MPIHLICIFRNALLTCFLFLLFISRVFAGTSTWIAADDVTTNDIIVASTALLTIGSNLTLSTIGSALQLKTQEGKNVRRFVIAAK